MDHRITIAILLVFGGTLAFTFFVVSLTTTVQTDGVALASGAGGEEGGGGGEGAGEVRPDVSPRDELLKVLDALDARVEQWRRDHGGRHPDFNAYSSWEQFLQNTDATGTPRPAGKIRAYLQRQPVNPLNKLSSVATVDKPLRPAERLPAEIGRAGFVYSTADRCFWGTNGSGRMILVRGTTPVPPTAPAPPAPATTPTTAPTAAPTPAATTAPSPQ